MYACMHAELLWLCPTLCDPMDCSPLGSSVHGIFLARILEWVAMTSSRASSRPRLRTWFSRLLYWQAGSLPLVPLGKPWTVCVCHFNLSVIHSFVDGYLCFFLATVNSVTVNIGMLCYAMLCYAMLSHFSRVRLCVDRIDGSPPGSPDPGILKARTLEWVAISFSNAWKWEVKVILDPGSLDSSYNHTIFVFWHFTKNSAFRFHQNFILWLNCMYACMHAELLWLCPTLSDPMDCSPPGSSIHGIFQARVLEWGAIAYQI